METRSSKEVISMLKSQGWTVKKKRGKGSHTLLGSPDGTKIVTVPHSKEQPKGTLRSIEKAVGARL